MDNKNKEEQIEYEAKKPLLEAFKDLFKRPAALPGDIPSKHKLTTMDMQTSMNFREFRASLMKSVGKFFQSLSQIGSPKKEESPNKYINNHIITAKSNEKVKNDTEPVVSQQPIIPETISTAKAHTLSTGNIQIDTTIIKDAKNIAENTLETDASTDMAPVDITIDETAVQKSTISTGTIPTGQIAPRPKHVIRRRPDNGKGDLEL